MAEPSPPEPLSCPVPLRTYPRVVLGHGGGGRLSSDLLEQLFLPRLRSPELEQRADAAVLELNYGSRLAFTTDSYVVRPLFFPGGSIAELALHGTINDLAMVGARPLALSAAFILEEGFPIEQLEWLADRLGQAARAVGVPIVTGDTKVVERGHGDGCFITTSGLGTIPAGREPDPSRVQPGDAVLVSGTLGDHGLAILSVREGLEFESPIVSDTAPLHDLVDSLFLAVPEVRALRDPTRGGLAATLNEIAGRSNVGILLDEAAIPLSPAVRSACELLGLDPLHIANEGKLVAFVPDARADQALQALRSHPLGRDAQIIGQATADHPGLVALRTPLGGTRVVPLPQGELLPRIC